MRHRGKIEAVINNAQRAREMIEREGSLAAFVWRHEPDPATLPPAQTAPTSPESIALSKALKKRGWKFVGRPRTLPPRRRRLVSPARRERPLLPPPHRERPPPLPRPRLQGFALPWREPRALRRR
ncbi:DNA-3-methyladenine glycosylase I, partial [Bacillus altitudinis]|uniref:DNA-3-methyladenine glycosylase I n=1 Tax=Bacillus altitudinis TaxID=293387 RepID=UPI0022450D33